MHEDDRIFAYMEVIETISSDTDGSIADADPDDDIATTQADTLVVADLDDCRYPEDVADLDDFGSGNDVPLVGAMAALEDADAAYDHDAAHATEDPYAASDHDAVDGADCANRELGAADDPDDADEHFCDDYLMNGSCMEAADCALMPPPPPKKIRFTDTPPSPTYMYLVKWGCGESVAMFEISRTCQRPDEFSRSIYDHVQ